MLRTGQEYRDSLRDGRVVWMNGERVDDVSVHPAFKPVVDIRARMFDMTHEEEHRDLLTYVDEAGDTNATLLKLPYVREDWYRKRKGVDVVLNEIAGVVTRVGDETVGECGRFMTAAMYLRKLILALQRTSRITSIE